MLNIALPDTLKAFLKSQIAETGAADESEYVYALILREQTRIAQKEKIESLLVEGIESGTPIDATEQWWAEKRTQLTNRFRSSEA